MAFDMSEYVDVKTRLKQALASYPDLRISETKPMIVVIDGHAFVEACITVKRDPTDENPTVAYCWEPYPGKTPYTRDSEQANASTSALGRALGYMGFGIDKSIASANEVQSRQTVTTKPAAHHDDDDIPHPAGRVEGLLNSAGITYKVASLDERRDTPASTKQLDMLVAMAAERGMEFDPEAPLTYSEGKEMFLTFKAIPRVKK